MLDENEILLQEGKGKQLNASIKSGFNVYENESDNTDNITYTSTTPSVASISAEGYITALKQGTSRIVVEDKVNEWKTMALVKVVREF